MPISKWVNRKTVVHLHNGLLCSRKKEGAPTLWDSMDGTGEHYAKWNKLDSERQIPYDLTFNRNLINKTNMLSKYNQRCWNREQTESNQRGGRRGKKGKHCQGTCIKDPWTEPKGGRIEGGRWGWMGWWKVVVGKWRKLYFNNKKMQKNPHKPLSSYKTDY